MPSQRLQMNIKVRTGTNIKTVLKSTVNIPQAFTELVKNSVQNEASECEILLSESEAVIVDNGIGLSIDASPGELNSFEKYFTYGNSYEQTGTMHLNLGQMGIGGKVANDRLSDSQNTHWQIESKDLSGKCHLLNYQPTETNFLDEYSPTIEEIPPESCSIKHNSGVKITIKNLTKEVKEGWDLQSIKLELQTFFGVLVKELKAEGISFDLLFQKEKINFDYKLPGIEIKFQEVFNYNLLNINSKIETMLAEVKFNLAYIKDPIELNNFHQKTIDIISTVKICSLSFSDLPCREECIKIAKTLGHKNFDYSIINRYFHSIIGFISCKNISKDIDNTGNNAKDISHHGLRVDHAITEPFYKLLGNSIVTWIIAFDLSNESTSSSAVEQLVLHASAMVMQTLNIEDLADLISDLGIEYETYDYVTIDKLAELGSAPVESALKTQKSLFSDDASGPPQEYNPFSNNSVAWQDTVLQLAKIKKTIPFEIVDFGEGQNYIMSKLDPFFKFKVLINSSNPKYKSFMKETTPTLMTLFLSELLIREIIFFTETTNVREVLDKKISKFYEDSYENIKLISQS